MLCPRSIAMWKFGNLRSAKPGIKCFKTFVKKGERQNEFVWKDEGTGPWLRDNEVLKN